VTALAVAGCANRPLLSPLTASTTTVRADGSDLDAVARIGYELETRADVTVDLLAGDGTRHILRERATRAPDRYEVRFDGTVAAANGDRRVIPNGVYRLRVTAHDALGRAEARMIELTVVDADTVPVEVLDLQTDLGRFTPDGDGVDDEVRISYRLTKASEATVYVTDEASTYYAIDPWRKRRATLQSHLWDGTTGGRVFGGKLLPNGHYVVHVEARDLAGNTSRATTPLVIANGGTPRLEIVDVRFSPIAIVLGGTLDVRITVRNTGTSAIKSWGPPPGHTYSAPDENYATIRNPADPGKPLFFERRGIWRVGVTWQNAPSAFPLRWGLFPSVKKPNGEDDWDSRSLAPGETVTVQGHVRVNVKEDSRQVRFSAGVVQEGVGFGDRVGEQMVQVGW
jgi:hypothetical protein